MAPGICLRRGLAALALELVEAQRGSRKRLSRVAAIRVGPSTVIPYQGERKFG